LAPTDRSQLISGISADPSDLTIGSYADHCQRGYRDRPSPRHDGRHRHLRSAAARRAMRRRHLSSAEVARCESGSWSPARTIASISPSAYLPDIALATFRSLAIGTPRTGSAYAVGRSRTPARRPRNRRRRTPGGLRRSPARNDRTRPAGRRLARSALAAIRGICEDENATGGRWALQHRSLMLFPADQVAEDGRGPQQLWWSQT
jgi:hypothetical protein